jgi:hypothetical protein
MKNIELGKIGNVDVDEVYGKVEKDFLKKYKDLDKIWNHVINGKSMADWMREDFEPKLEKARKKLESLSMKDAAIEKEVRNSIRLTLASNAYSFAKMHGLTKEDKTIIAKIDNYINEEEQQNLNKAVNAFIDGAQKIIDTYFHKNYENLNPTKLVTKKGGRYIKVIAKLGGVKGSDSPAHGDSVWAFIDAKEGPTFGDVYKAASWNAPAKGARGNVFSQQNGIEAVGVQGSIWYAKQGR